jgi:hypothetical protein
MDVILFRTFSHVIIMTQKVDPRREGGAEIFIKESSIKAIDGHQNLRKRDSKIKTYTDLKESYLRFSISYCSNAGCINNADQWYWEVNGQKIAFAAYQVSLSSIQLNVNRSKKLDRLLEIE